MCNNYVFLIDANKSKGRNDKKRKIRPNRMKVSENIPSEDELNSVKQKKKVCYSYLHVDYLVDYIYIYI